MLAFISWIEIKSVRWQWGTAVSRYVPANEMKGRGSRSPAVTPSRFSSSQPEVGQSAHTLMAFHINCFSLRQISANHGASRQHCWCPPGEETAGRRAGESEGRGGGGKRRQERVRCGRLWKARGGKRSLEGEGVRNRERERKRIDTYIGLYTHTHKHTHLLGEIGPG